MVILPKRFKKAPAGGSTQTFGGTHEEETLAIHRSALKRMRQNERRRIRNRSIRSALKTHVKKVLSAIEEKESERAKESFRKASSIIAKAASKGTIHRNTASRKISRLARKVNTLKAG